ncbi:GGDEF domain-containing protein [Deinococcus misasensis]|uniref:GGDEF domain-containing protein n=1 Tax=Deinococcus misasensis TaxID=392413 RepID=UPI0012F9EECF|nr:GGDEF domain-containing protein [Deinococcus misasensis]
MSMDGIFNAQHQLIWRSERLKQQLGDVEPVNVHWDEQTHPSVVHFEHAEKRLLSLEASVSAIPQTELFGLCMDQRSTLQDLHRAAYTDALTGLENRRAFEETLKNCTQSPEPLALVILDLDGLKRINDQHGHVQGDAFLNFVARQLQGQLRPLDRAFRIGGDEFAVILQGLVAAQVHVVYQQMKNIRDQLQQGPFATGDISAGVAFHPQESSGDARTLMRLADERMYEHKRSKTQQDVQNLVGSINRQAVIRGMGATLDVLLSREAPTVDYWKLMLNFAVQMVPSAQAGSLDLWDGTAFVKIAQQGFGDELLGLRQSPQAQLRWYGSTESHWINGIPRILREMSTIRTTSVFTAAHSTPDHVEVYHQSGRLGEIQCTLNAPITHQGRVYGHLNLDNFISNMAFNTDSLMVARELVRQCATVCHNLDLPCCLP